MSWTLNADGSKTERIYRYLRDRIIDGRFLIGKRLPSSRDMAKELGVSRALIVDVYEQLIAEGYLESRQGSGTYVADLGQGKPILSGLIGTAVPSERKEPAESGYRFEGIDFRPSLPALEYAPRKKWKEAALHVFDAAGDSEFGHDHPAGNWELRTQICRLLLQSKGIECKPSQIVVTAGATQAIALLCKLFVRPGEEIVAEDPTATFIHDIFVSAGAAVVPVPVDQEGLRINEIPGEAKPKFLFVTPSHQFPFGSILSAARRIQLLEYARSRDCYVVEDDYDSEFRYSGLPVRALRELNAERVIYIGTFSKNLFPALRLGYMVVPEELAAPLVRLKYLSGHTSPTLSQLILARFIAERQLERHVARMKRIYGKRRESLIAHLSRAFGSKVAISGDAAGLHLVADFPGYRFDSSTIALLDERHVRVYPAETYAIVKGNYEHKLIMGYGNVPERRIAEGIETLASVIHNNFGGA